MLFCSMIRHCVSLSVDFSSQDNSVFNRDVRGSGSALRTFSVLGLLLFLPVSVSQLRVVYRDWCWLQKRQCSSYSSPKHINFRNFVRHSMGCGVVCFNSIWQHILVGRLISCCRSHCLLYRLSWQWPFPTLRFAGVSAAMKTRF